MLREGWWRRRRPWCLFQDKSKWRKRVLVAADRVVVPDSESESELHELLATWNSEADSRACTYCSAATAYCDGLTGGESLLTICEACDVAYCDLDCARRTSSCPHGWEQSVDFSVQEAELACGIGCQCACCQRQVELRACSWRTGRGEKSTGKWRKKYNPWNRVVTHEISLALGLPEGI